MNLMKKLILSISLVIVVICSFVLMSNKSIDKNNYTPITEDGNSNLLYPSGSPGNYTGSPGDAGNTCTQCHSTANFNLVPTITTTIPSTGYVFGQTYIITLSTTSNSADAWGFELTAEKNLDNSNVGVFDLTGASGSLKLIKSNTSVTQSNDNSSSWSFNWTAPSTDEGDITFYAAVLAGNGSGEDNDDTKLISESVSLSTLGIAEANLLTFEIFPNPSQDFLTIQLPNEMINGSIELFDYLGRSVKSKKISNIDNKLNLSNLNQGIYFVKVNSEGKMGVQKFIKI